MTEIKGKGNIVARVVCDSISIAGVRLTTFEVEFPRYILSEANTHRAHSRNAASTRAIPILRMLEQIANEPAMPIYYGKNQAGMSASEELDDQSKSACEQIINEMREFCMGKVKELSELGLHKQHAGRYIEAWQMVKGVISATDFENWYWLRDHEAAQPEIAELARCMSTARDASAPRLLKPGEYHLPYLGYACDDSGILRYGDIGRFGTDEPAWEEYSLEDAIKVSCARCAAVSYRRTDYGVEKSREVYARLVGDDRKHASALEHVATPMQRRAWDIDMEDGINIQTMPYTWEKGVSHSDRQGQLWSGNIRGWVQHRKLIPGENKSEY